MARRDEIECWLTAQRGILGTFANRWFTTTAGVICALALVALNVVLLVLVFTGA